MADLIRTIYDDNEDGAEAPPGEDDDPILSQRDALAFDDLVSEDEHEENAASWNFDAHDGALVEKQEQTNSLEEKIRQRRVDLEAKEAARGKAKDKEEEEAPTTRQKEVDTSHLETGIHFAELRLCRPLLRAVSELKFTSPTPIQRDVIPPALRGMDIMATAETGSGKTASFLLPVLERLCQSPNVRVRRRDASGRTIMGPVATKALILIPTRELAVQCHAMLVDLAKHTFVTYHLVVGGFVSKEQASALRSQPDIVIATPGRLLDHLMNSCSVHMELLEIVIFDEADRLLEMGFKDECAEVLKRCSKGRQTMLFSATLSDSVDNLASLALVKPVRVHSSPANKVVPTLEQEFVKAPSEDYREAVLMSLCERNYTSHVIVFCATKKSAHRVAIVMGLCGLRFAEIHGNLTQGDRVKGLQRFQHQEADFLVATDLAARGLDLNNVETVINFHLPLDVARYVHRVGRTARMGRVGKAVTIYCPNEYTKVKRLGKQCRSKVEKVTVVKRTVAPEAIRQWANKIIRLNDDVNAILEDESMEMELRTADILTERAENMRKHKEEIRSRPEKMWHMSFGEKKKLKAADAAIAREKAEADDEETLDAAPTKREAKEEGKEEETLQTPHERWKKRMEVKLAQQDKARKAERLQEEKQIRAMARRRKGAERAAKRKRVG